MPGTNGPLPATGVTPSAWKTWALSTWGVVEHMPPVPPLGSRSRSVTFHASLVPVFWTLKPNCPHCPRLIVAGPDSVNTRSGAPTIPPTVIETLALAVCGGVFHVTTPVLVTIVPAASVLPSVARKRRSIVPPGASGP